MEEVHGPPLALILAVPSPRVTHLGKNEISFLYEWLPLQAVGATAKNGRRNAEMCQITPLKIEVRWTLVCSVYTQHFLTQSTSLVNNLFTLNESALSCQSNVSHIIVYPLKYTTFSLSLVFFLRFLSLSQKSFLFCIFV